MKRIVLALSSVLFGVSLLHEGLPIKGAKTQDSASFGDIAVRTGLKNGDYYTDGALVDYAVFHGNVANASIAKFSSYTASSTDWSCTLGSDQDNAYAYNWKVFTRNNDGVIVGIKAKSDVKISINKTSEGGWVDGGVLSIFKQDVDGVLSTLKENTLTGTNDLALYGGDFSLANGETLYYQYRFEWGDFRNMENCPSFSFLDLTPADTLPAQESASYGDMVVRTAINGGAAYTDGKLADYQILHGNVNAGAINPFATYVSDSGAWSGQLGNDTDDAYCLNWKLFSRNNDGIIAAITAKTEVAVTISKSALGGWSDNAVLGIYLKTAAGTLSTVSEKELTTASTVEDYGGSFDLMTGDTLYYQFKFEWGDYRNMENLPAFTFDNKNSTSSSSSEGGTSSSSSTSGETSSQTSEDFSLVSSVNLNDLAYQVAAKDGADLALQDMAIGIYQGNVSSNIAKFPSYTSSSVDMSALLSNSGTFDGADMAAVSTWRIKTTLSSSPIFMVKATKDIKLTIAHPEITGGWIDANTGLSFSLYMKSGANLYKQWTRDINSLPQVENAFGGTLMLKSDDIAYFTFSSTIANERNINIVPSFASDPAAYDEATRNSQMHMSKDSETMWDALTACINNSYDDVDYPLASVGFYHGTMKDLKKFDYHEGDGKGTASDALWDSIQKHTGFQRWQIQCSDGDDAILKITAKENQKITLTHTAIWADAWSATNSLVRYYAVDTDGTKVILKTLPIATQTSEDAYGITVSLEMGQSLYLDYYTIDGNWYSVNLAPKLSFSIDDYDATALPAFQAMRDLANLKQNEKAKVTDLVASLTESDYSIDNWAQINNLKDEALSAIDEAQDSETVTALSEKALADIRAISTLAQETTILNAYKESKEEEVEAFFASLNENDYSEEDWAIIVAAYGKVKADIDSASSKTVVNSLVTAFKANVNKIETNPRSTMNPAVVWGSIGGGIVLLAGAGLATFLILRAKKRKKA